MKADFAKLAAELKDRSDPVSKPNSKPHSLVTPLDAQANLDGMSAERLLAPKLSPETLAAIGAGQPNRVSGQIAREEKLLEAIK